MWKLIIMNELFLKALPLLKKIEENGFEAVFVGGSVRDYLLNRPIHDVDIATSATPDEIKEIFPKTVDVGIQHGTVMVLEYGESYEITTYRVESEYIDYRKPKEVQFIRSLKDDLERRDFTMNAIAMNKEGELIDPFNGQLSIINRVIDTVGEPNDRFSEDALRMMRAIRFVSQLDFTCTPRVVQALHDNRILLNNISIERITAEFEKLLCGRNARNAFQILIETELYEHLPGLKDCKHHLLRISPYNWGLLRDIDEKWAAILYNIITVDEVEDYLRLWKLPIKRIRHIKSILQSIRKNDFLNKMELFSLGLECSVSAIRVHSFLHEKTSNEIEDQIKILWNSLEIQNSSQLAVKGNDLLEWSNREKGPWVKELLLIITEKVINKEVQNNKEAIYEEVQRCNLI